MDQAVAYGAIAASVLAAAASAAPVLEAAASVAAGSVSAPGEITGNWFRQPVISPDGQKIVFAHGGDLYTVPSAGGRAVPLTLADADETSPVFSPDGSLLAFASDRHGNHDVFVMPAGGGESRRLTFHSASDRPTGFTADGTAVLFESSRLDAPESALFPSGTLSELYSVGIDGGTPRMVLTTPALEASCDAEGLRIVYEDRRGYENELRKHHVSPVARDIWLYDEATGAHRRLTDYPGEDREPVWLLGGPQKGGIAFLSERSGDQNVFVMNPDGTAVEQLTFFEHHPVRHLSASRDGVLAFSWHGDVYTLAPGGTPRMVGIEVAADGRLRTERRTESTGATEMHASPNGREVAIVVRGDVFVVSVEHGTTRRITSTPGQERSVMFSSDGRSLVYAAERGGSWDVMESRIVEDDEPFFSVATRIEERAVVATEAEEFQPRWSPDGRMVAYLHNRTRLNVIETASGRVTTVLSPETFYSYSDGDHWFRWSPDSRWLAVHYCDRPRRWYNEAGLVGVNGEHADEPINLSLSGHDDGSPRWGFGGRAVLWLTDRYGEKAHGSWGGELDVVGAFLTADAWDEFRRSKEDRELLELDERRRSGGGRGEESATQAPSGELAIETEGLHRRTVRLTGHSSDLSDMAMTADGRRLYTLSSFEGGYDLWAHDLVEGSVERIAKLDAGRVAIQLLERHERIEPGAGVGGAARGRHAGGGGPGDAAELFVLADGRLSVIDLPGGAQRPVAYRAELQIDHHAERVAILEHVWRQTAQKFYRPDLHGVDWAFYRQQYEPKLAGIVHNRQMAELLSELLGELNASHTGSSYRGGGARGDESRTAALGVLFDPRHRGYGVRIAEVIANGPLDRADLGVRPGMVITHIDGQEITPTANVYGMLNHREGVRTRLTLLGGDGNGFDVVVRPIGLGAESELRYRRWVEQREEIVRTASGGRLAYAHIRGMDDESFREFYARAMGPGLAAEAIVIDTRFNGGGWLHDDLVTFLTGVNYVNLYPRNDEGGNAMWRGEPGRRWDRPSIVVMSEGNYSDAHFFPWAYREMEIGQLVGSSVAGTATAVWWERLHTGDLVFGIPQVGTKGADGLYLENQQLDPDHLVLLDPENAAKGIDTQLLKAVEVMLEQLDAR